MEQYSYENAVYQANKHSIVHQYTTFESLEKIINNKVEKIGYQEYMRRLMDRHYKEEYDWEKNRLREKFLIDAHFDDITIPEEIIDYK